MNKAQLLLLKMVATFLMRKNGSTTTLEIKKTLRERFPTESWYQSDISQAMIDIHDSGEIKGLEFVDTGEFRIYQKTDSTTLNTQGDAGINTVLNSTPEGIQRDIKPRKKSAPKSQSGSVSKPESKTVTLAKYDNRTPKSGNLSRTAVVDLMRDSKGRFYTVTFIKTDGSERTMNGQTKKDNFMDNLGYINFRESNGNIRRVNPKTIKEISISGNVYKVK